VAQPGRGGGEKTVIACRHDLAEPEPEPDTIEPEPEPTLAAPTVGPPEENRLVTRTRERYAAVHQLLGDAMSISAICRTLRLDRKTVQRFARATTIDDLLVKARNRGSVLDRFKPYLHERFNAGHTEAARLTEEDAVPGLPCPALRATVPTPRRSPQGFPAHPHRAGGRTVRPDGR
jgi:hypothetical protein